MTKKDQAKQIDLEEAVQAAIAQDLTGVDLTDPFTGVIFRSNSRNHYELNDGKPVAPAVELNRPTIRQRIENLINRDPAVLQRYLSEGPPDGTEGLEMEVPDDPEAPLTASEANYLESIASEVAEQAPLPDDGLPRPQPGPPVSQSQAGETPGGGGAPATSAPPKGAAAASSAAAPASTDPTR